MSFLSILSLPATSMAQPSSAAEFVELPRSEFLAEMETILEAAWPGHSVMFTRLDPAYADLLPPYHDWDAQTKELAACVYDAMASDWTLEKLAEYVLLQTEFAAFLANRTDLNFSNMGDDATIQDRFSTPSTEYVKASSSCGLLDYQGQQMQQSGLMGVLLNHMQ